MMRREVPAVSGLLRGECGKVLQRECSQLLSERSRLRETPRISYVCGLVVDERLMEMVVRKVEMH